MSYRKAVAYSGANLSVDTGAIIVTVAPTIVTVGAVSPNQEMGEIFVFLPSRLTLITQKHMRKELAWL